MSFHELPVELLPFIVQYLLKPHYLFQACLVNKIFYAYSVPVLYERPAVYAWHKKGKERAKQLFWTLANCPKLAIYVRRLDLRDFPKAISRDSANELSKLCVSGLNNCVNLSQCTWTRDGSLKDEILEALSHCPSLSSLEINGRARYNYNPQTLKNFERLHKISVIMPSAEVVGVLHECFQRNFDTLQELTIICKFTSIVTDTWLQTVAPSLSRLQKLHLTGCRKVTHRGIMDILNANTVGITDLALEGVSPIFEIKELAARCSHRLSCLSSITLTLSDSHITNVRSWLSDVNTLLFDALELKKFHMYASGYQTIYGLSIFEGFVQQFIERHRETLTRFAVLRLPMSIPAVEFVVNYAQNLEELFISTWRKDLNKLGPVIAKSTSIQSMHITYAYDTITDGELLIDHDGTFDAGSDRASLLNGTDRPNTNASELERARADFAAARLDASDDASMSPNELPSMAELEDLASQFGGNVKHFGVHTRVWQIERHLSDGPGQDGVCSPGRVKLAPYESPDIPDIFLVMRT